MAKNGLFWQQRRARQPQVQGQYTKRDTGGTSAGHPIHGEKGWPAAGLPARR